MTGQISIDHQLRRTCSGHGDFNLVPYPLNKNKTKNQNGQVTSKTQALHATCESLLEEQKRLEAQVNALSSPLERFRALEELGPALGLPFASPVRGDEVSKSGVAVTAGRSPVRVSYGGGGTVVGGGSGNLRRSSSFGRGGPAGRALLYPGSDDFAQVG